MAASTLRGQAGAVRLFCEYLTDPAYAWAEVCWGYFGTHPVQVCPRWNTPRHVQDGESGPERRAFTVAELQVFFDHLDDRIAAVHGRGVRAGCRRSGTRCWSRPRTRSGCAAVRSRCSTWLICHPRCGAARLLPGLAGGTAICRDCAGITLDFTCCRCGIEGLLTSGKICER